MRSPALIQDLYGETVSWSLAIASTAQLAIGRGSTPLGDTTFLGLVEVMSSVAALQESPTNASILGASLSIMRRL